MSRGTERVPWRRVQVRFQIVGRITRIATYVYFVRAEVLMTTFCGAYKYFISPCGCDSRDPR